MYVGNFNILFGNYLGFIIIITYLQKTLDEKEECIHNMDNQEEELKALLSQANSRVEEKELLIFEMEEKVETLNVELEQIKKGMYKIT